MNRFGVRLKQTFLILDFSRRKVCTACTLIYNVPLILHIGRAAKFYKLSHIFTRLLVIYVLRAARYGTISKGLLTEPEEVDPEMDGGI